MISRAEELADEHWGYVGKLFEFVYKSALIHGYGHGYEDGRNDAQRIL